MKLNDWKLLTLFAKRSILLASALPLVIYHLLNMCPCWYPKMKGTLEKNVYLQKFLKTHTNKIQVHRYHHKLYPTGNRNKLIAHKTFNEVDFSESGNRFWKMRQNCDKKFQCIGRLLFSNSKEIAKAGSSVVNK